MMDSGSKRREAAAAVKAQAAEAESRDRRIKIIGSVVVALVVVGIIAAGVIGARSGQPSVDPNNALPQSVLSKTYGWPLTPIDSAKSTLTIYEDPQCPYCGQFEAAYGETVAKLSSDGTVNVVYQMAAFLDDNLPQSKKASRRAINALGCAIDQGAGLAYHRLIYASQPQQEGAGWTDEQLLKLGSLSKLEGDALAKFESCAKAGTYLGWSDNATQVFRDNQIPGTPYIELDGKQVPDSALASVTAFVDYVTQNKK
jgi:protein-disulfide isomerase